MPWSARFDDSIPITGRNPLRTLRDVAKFLMCMPPRERIQPYWLDAIEALVLVVEKNGPTMIRSDRHHASIEPRETGPRASAETQDGQEIQGCE